MTDASLSATAAHLDSSNDSFTDGPRLLADVGGTNARFALETAPGRIEAIAVLPCKAYPSFVDAVRAYLNGPLVAAAGGPALRHAAIAIANPVAGDQIRMTNHHWQFSIEAARCALGLDTLLVVNDFEALAMALPGLTPEQKRQVGAGAVRAGSAIGLLGAGTGLGVSGLVPCGGNWIALSAEGGHVTFAPSNETEMDIIRFAWREFPHVSAERLLSGVGLELIYRALAGECAICDETIECFCVMLGTIAANLAVTLGTLGGLYIGGGIVPRLGQRFDRSGFRRRFESKGRFSDYLAAIPTFVITAEYPAFSGVAAILAEKLKTTGGA